MLSEARISSAAAGFSCGANAAATRSASPYSKIAVKNLKALVATAPCRDCSTASSHRALGQNAQIEQRSQSRDADIVVGSLDQPPAILDLVSERAVQNGKHFQNAGFHARLPPYILILSV